MVFVRFQKPRVVSWRCFVLPVPAQALICQRAGKLRIRRLGASYLAFLTQTECIFSFKYWLTRSYDACFRLKRKLFSNDDKDPGLGTGWSYFVENEPYKAFTDTLGPQDEVNTFFF